MKTISLSEDIDAWADHYKHKKIYHIRDMSMKVVSLTLPELATIPEVKSLIEVLRTCEWTWDDAISETCPSCHYSRKHDKGCKLKAALAPFNDEAA